MYLHQQKLFRDPKYISCTVIELKIKTNDVLKLTTRNYFSLKNLQYRAALSSVSLSMEQSFLRPSVVDYIIAKSLLPAKFTGGKGLCNICGNFTRNQTQGSVQRSRNLTGHIISIVFLATYPTTKDNLLFT